MHIFIINLDRSADRLQEQYRQFDALGLTFERLPAVSVQDIDPKFYQARLTQSQRLMKQSEVACLLSHKLAWEQVVAKNEPCVILEDDAVLVKDFSRLLKGIEQQQPQGDLINLEVHGKQKIVGTGTHLVDEYQMLPLFLDKSGTGGYILYPTGAKKLLDRFTRTLTLADDFIYNCPNLNMYQIEPAALLQSDKCQLYGVPFDAYPLQSMIGVINNTQSIQLSFIQKFTLKYNRIIGQIMLGIRTLKALQVGKKRHILVDQKKFHH